MQHIDNLVSTARTRIQQDFPNGEIPQMSDIEGAVDAVAPLMEQALGCSYTANDREAAAMRLVTIFNVSVHRSSVLDADNPDHQQWLNDNLVLLDPEREPITWRFWSRYKRYLENEQGREPSTLASLDKTTTDILRRLEDPKRPGAWDRRGLVVGNVQSGKTGNFTGLICKAVDAGYQFVVVLAGMHETLRRQTQVRLDMELRGRQTRVDADAETVIGVGKFDDDFTIKSITTSAIDSQHGDFNKSIAERRGLLEIQNEPLYLVVKKNVKILNHLNNWVESLHQYDGSKVRSVPLLVIDDEADQASVNTADDPEETDQDMSAINAQIRRLLSNFEQSAYVGYTATPFANIFIRPDARDLTVEDDLFPRDFIVSLEAPTNYVGPTRLFGLDRSEEAGIEEQEGLPLVRDIADHHDAFPPGHTKQHEPPALPDSLMRAMKSFMLACAVRALRGQSDKHNSMLVHVSRFNDVQDRVRALVEEERDRIVTRLQTHDGRLEGEETPIFEEFQSHWENDFVPTMFKIDGDAEIPPWPGVLDRLLQVAPRIRVMLVNGLSNEALSYDTHKTPLNVIAIGGDKLSRGFTLEGLTVSYYLRATTMYDTLMQMGRWFGYRDSYLDVCRIYTTPGLQANYRFLATAIEELRADFRRMAQAGAKPIEFGHKVRVHPTGALSVTSRNKSRSVTRLRMSLNGHLAQTLAFSLDNATNRANYQATRRFMDRLHSDHGKPLSERGMRRWDRVPGELVLDFLQQYQTHPGNSLEVAVMLPTYIEKQIAQDRLLDWTVAFDTFPRSKGKPIELAGEQVRLIRREKGHKKIADDTGVRIKVLTSPSHEMADLTRSQRQAALESSQREYDDWEEDVIGKKQPKNPPKTPYPSHIRTQRDPRRGLLLLYFVDGPQSWGVEMEDPTVGFGVSFPKFPGHDPGVEYVANRVYQWEAGLD